MKFLSEIIKKKGWVRTKNAVINENFLWNKIILFIPKNLSKNLAVSPEKIRKDKKINPSKPANFPML